MHVDINIVLLPVMQSSKGSDMFSHKKAIEDGPIDNTNWKQSTRLVSTRADIITYQHLVMQSSTDPDMLSHQKHQGLRIKQNWHVAVQQHNHLLT